VFKRRSSRPEDNAHEGEGAPNEFGGPLFPAGNGSPKADDGLGVPPFRAAPTKDKETAMARPPFAPNPTSAPTVPPVPRPGLPNPQHLSRGMSPSSDPSERRTLVVGRGISVQGTITDAERLVVEGTVEATMIHATELAVSQGGVFKGEVEVEEAEIAGTIDGVITARTSLLVRSTGRVIGRARCRRLQVEDGGQITGQIEMLTDAPSPSATATGTSSSLPVHDLGFERPEMPRTDFSRIESN
jgi:cytoskeletal protein CcmA (bactofilin family)